MATCAQQHEEAVIDELEAYIGLQDASTRDEYGDALLDLRNICVTTPLVFDPNSESEHIILHKILLINSLHVRDFDSFYTFFRGSLLYFFAFMSQCLKKVTGILLNESNDRASNENDSTNIYRR